MSKFKPTEIDYKELEKLYQEVNKGKINFTKKPNVTS